MSVPVLPTVTVIGLGPGGPDLVSVAALDAVRAHPPHTRWARTDRHPAVSILGDHASFDRFYDTAERLDDVYPAIVDELVGLAARYGSVLYAVPGSPLVAERTVELLRARAAGTNAHGDASGKSRSSGAGGGAGAGRAATAELAVVVEPGLSFLDLAWARLGIDPLAAGARLVDGQRFETEAAGERGPLLVAQCDSREVLSAIKLSVEAPPEGTVTVLQRLGLSDEAVFEVDWQDLDRVFEPDHLTSLWVPHLAAPVAAELVNFAELVRTLRARCPWDAAQTHASLRSFAIEEAYEVAEAIDWLDSDTGEGIDELEEELGDLLFQVFFHATLAAEAGWFNLADVARTVHDKLVRRHPHVFGAGAALDAPTVVANWDQIKRAEKGRDSVMDGVCTALPPRLFAAKVASRAAKLGLPADFAAQHEALDAAEAALLAAADRLEAAARRHEQQQ